MNNIYQIYLISDSTGETLDRIFLALKAQFNNFHYKTNHFSFTRTENQIQKILENCKKQKKTIILYTIVDEKLSNFLKKQSRINNIPCYGLLGDLIDSFSKLLNQNALNVPSRQHIMNDEYYKKIDAIQFTMNHDDGNAIGDIEKSDIPIVNKNSIPENIKRNKLKKCIIGLIAEPERLAEIRKNRMTSLKETGNQKYTNLRKIQDEVESSRNTFIKFKWPTIDVSRKSVEETAASVIKIYEISRKNA